MKLVFIDAEYTGEHAYTTLVSLGLVTLDGEGIGVALSDYDRDQVTDWLRENVLSAIDESRAVSSREAYEEISAFLSSYAQGDRVSLVSAGLGSDLLLLFELYRYACPELRYFHALKCLPDYLNHTWHLDLNTLLLAAGVDPGIDRELFARATLAGRRHESLYDAHLARACFLRLLEEGLLPAAIAAAAKR